MKKGRLQKILEIVENQEIETQEELAKQLCNAGFSVTQATVSRDIRALKLSKIATDSGGQRYVAYSKENAGRPQQADDRYLRVLKEGFVSMEAAQNLVVIRTVSGMAMAVAAALDSARIDEILGCIAGDDTIMVACRDNAGAVSLIRKLKDILKK